VFTQVHAKAIAKKLDCTIAAGRKHDLAQVFVRGKLVASFGIRRASKEVSHSYLPNQLHITQKNCRDLHDCSLSKQAYIEDLDKKGLLPPEEQKPQQT
jgi:hypothetical protein